MIIKSMGRRKSSKKGQHLFKTLFDYLFHEHKAETRDNVDIDLQHNIPNGLSHDEILDLFLENAKLLRDIQGANIGYHEIISLPANDLDRERVKAALKDIGRIYLEERAPENIAVGMVHRDKDHVHLHIIMSSNRLYDRDRLRLSRKDFLGVQEKVSSLARSHFPELNIENLYSTDNVKTNKHEKIRTTRSEQEKQRREKMFHGHDREQKTGQTKKINRKAQMATHLHSAFELYRSMEDLAEALKAQGYELYQRGKSMGVIDAEGKRHRFSTLGLEPHYSAWQQRMGQGRGQSAQSQENAPESTTTSRSRHTNKTSNLDNELDRRIRELNQAREQGKERDDEAER